MSPALPLAADDGAPLLVVERRPAPDVEPAVPAARRTRRPRLRRSDPAATGLTRRRSGKGWTYRDADGRRVTDPETLARIRGLVIPPAWTDVWSCPHADGHLQVTGVDTAGRRQYRYHDARTEERGEQKFARALRLGLVLPDLRARLSQDLTGRGLSRERVLSCAVRLSVLGLFRIGGEEYARDDASYGLATVLRERVSLRRGEVRFTLKLLGRRTGR